MEPLGPRGGGGDLGLVLWLFGAAISIVMAVMGYAHKRIGDVRREAMQAIAEVRQDVKDRDAGSRLDRNNLWVELRRAQQESTEIHRDILEKMAGVPDRKELREDLAASEARIRHLIEGLSRRRATDA